MTLLASYIALFSLRYFILSPEVAIGEPFAQRFAQYITPLLFHAGGASIALFLGAWNFWGAFRKKYLDLHRWIGRIYLLAVVVGGTSGLFLAMTAVGGLPTRIGFGALAALWLATAVMAYLTIRQGDVQAHRAWVIRSYALTFSGVMLRLWMPLFLSLGYDFPEVYTTIAWLCWVPNLLAAELIISSSNRKRENLVQTA
jgi:uncharacterized membrane protein